MINWVKRYRRYISLCDGFNKAVVVADTLFCIYSAPAIVFHELCHFIIGIFLWDKFNFMRIKFLHVNGDSTEFTPVDVEMSFAAKPFRAMIIGIAPLIGLVTILIPTMIFIDSYYLLVYCLTCYHTLLLSSDDIATFFQGLKDYKSIKSVCKEDEK